MITEKKFSIPALNHDNFKAAGYKFWESRGSSVNADGFWQKSFKDELGIKYMIAFYEYDWSKIEQHPTKDISYEPKGYLSLPDDENLRISVLVNKDATIEHVESIVEKAFINMGCVYHEKY